MLTVIFATRNGGEALGEMLESFTALQAPDDGWRIVAVDNGSSDGSFERMQGFADRLPLTVLRHDPPGKNAALNSALEHAEGDLWVFTDDDILPNADWLLRLREAADNQEEFAIFGGRIEPRWNKQPEPWLLDVVNKEIAYALTAPDWKAGEISGGWVWGPNMAVRASLFVDEGHRFNEKVGPGAGQYAMGSETEFNLRMEKVGHRCCHVPGAVVRHIIPAEYIERKWLMGRAYRYGRGYCLRWRVFDNYKGPRWRGVPRYLYGNVVRGWFRHQRARLVGDNKTRFATEWELKELRGILDQARELASAQR